MLDLLGNHEQLIAVGGQALAVRMLLEQYLAPCGLEAPDAACDGGRVDPEHACGAGDLRRTCDRQKDSQVNLIAQAGGPSGQAGPYVICNGGAVCCASGSATLSPPWVIAPKRIRLAIRVEADLSARGILPVDTDEARRLVDEEVRERVRASGKTNISYAVTELVRAGLVERHYQGYRVDHANRGAQRQAVYAVPQPIRAALASSSHAPVSLAV